MPNLYDKVLPFNATSIADNRQVNADQNFLLDTAFNAFPDTWSNYAQEYIISNPEYLIRHSLVLPSCAEDEDFDAWEMLTMQIMSKRDAVHEIQAILINQGYAEAIIDRLREEPVFQSRIKAGEVFPQKEITEVNQLIAKFKPTIILVEDEPKDQEELVSNYQMYLKNQSAKTTYDGNEIKLMGFEIGRIAGVKRIYGIDHRMGYNYNQGALAKELNAKKYFQTMMTLQQLESSVDMDVKSVGLKKVFIKLHF